MLLRNDMSYFPWERDIQHFATLLYQKETANVLMCLWLHLAHYKRCATSRIVSPNQLHKTSGTLLQKKTIVRRQMDLSLRWSLQNFSPAPLCNEKEASSILSRMPMSKSPTFPKQQH